MLANHIWSVGGSGNPGHQQHVPAAVPELHDEGCVDVQRSTPRSTYDWKGEQWTVPINFTVSKLTHIGKQPISFGVAARYWAEGPATAPHGWGARFVVTFLFPA